MERRVERLKSMWREEEEERREKKGKAKERERERERGRGRRGSKEGMERRVKGGKSDWERGK